MDVLCPCAPPSQRRAGEAVHPTAAPYFHEGIQGGVGVLLIHGLTASPTEVRPIADFLKARISGLTLSCPLLPGHGTTPRELGLTPCAAWQGAVTGELDRLACVCDSVCVIGVSLGAVLAVQAALTDSRVRSLVLLSPVFTLRRRTTLAVSMLRHFVPHFKKSRRAIERSQARGLFSYDRYPLHAVWRLLKLARKTRTKLGRLSVPTMLAAGRRDRHVAWSTVTAVRDELGVEGVEFFECPASGHILPHGPDAPKLFAAIHGFLSRHHFA